MPAQKQCHRQRQNINRAAKVIIANITCGGGREIKSFSFELVGSLLIADIVTKLAA